MTDPNPSTGVPQFNTAEFPGKAGSEKCQICGLPVGATYYRVQGKLACASCGEKAKTALPSESHSGFLRGVLFGIGGAILGLALYSTFAIVTGLVIGYVSLAVGYIVGKAIRAGARGQGGRHYQIAAILLTYAAVSMSAIPIGIHEYMKAHPNSASPQVTPSANTDSEGTASTSDHPGLGSALLSLAFVGLASPFLELQDPVHGGIGLIILFVGIRIAWQLTGERPADGILGPFSNAPVAQTPSTG
jgi:hypothetical protein